MSLCTSWTKIALKLILIWKFPTPHLILPFVDRWWAAIEYHFCFAAGRRGAFSTGLHLSVGARHCRGAREPTFGYAHQLTLLFLESAVSVPGATLMLANLAQERIL